MNNDDNKVKTIEELTNLAFQGAIEAPPTEELEETSNNINTQVEEPIQNKQSLDYLNKTQEVPPNNLVEQKQTIINQNNNINTTTITNNSPTIYKTIPVKKHRILPVLLFLIILGLASTYIATKTNILERFLSKEINEKEITSLIDNNDFLYLAKDNKTLFMRFIKLKEGYNLQIKGAEYEATTNGIKTNGIVMQYKLTLNEGKLSNEDNSINIEKELGLYKLSITEDELKDLSGNYKLIDIKKDKCKYPKVSNDNRVGIYTLNDDSGTQIHVVSQEDGKYTVSGMVIKGEEIYILYDTNLEIMENNNALSNDGNVLYRFDNNKITLSKVILNGNKYDVVESIINDTYKIKKDAVCQKMYDEIKDLAAMGDEQMEGYIR